MSQVHVRLPGHDKKRRCVAHPDRCSPPFSEKQLLAIRSFQRRKTATTGTAVVLPPPVQILDLVKNMVSFVPSTAANN
jgi:hypothetical protein